MSLSRTNVDDTLTLISLGISEEEIETNDLRCEDTIELDKIIEEVNKINNGKN